jgi:hypothetical protein
VRPDVVRIAHDADPAGLGRQRVAEDDAELGPVVVGEDHVRAVVEVVGDRGEQREPEGGGPGRRASSGSSSRLRNPMSAPYLSR